MQASSIVLIRGGEGIQEPIDLPPSIAAILEIDSRVPLRNRGLTPDCKRVFDLDFYAPENVSYYYQAESLVLTHRKFGPMYQSLKDRIFKAYPIEAKYFDDIKIQRIDAHGAGALWIQGVLKVFVALVGRPYEPTKRDTDSDLPKRIPETKGLHKGEIWVSMLTDLLGALVELQPDEVGLVCGAFGGTGPSVSAVIGDILADAKWNIVRVQLVSMPDAFMVNEHVPPETADRLAAVIQVLQPLAIYAGLGQSGVFWHFLGQEMRTIGERFSNVVSKKLLFGAASAITIVGVPFRSDLKERWLVGQSALHPILEDEALSRLLQGRDFGLITFEAVSYQNGTGVRIRVNNPSKMMLWQWELLLPALAVARSGIGTMLLPVDVVIKKGGLLAKQQIERQNLPVESVPLMDNLLSRAGVSSVDRLAEATAFWALTKVEREMLRRCRQQTFETAFGQIEQGFVQNSREILGDLVFKNNVFPPASAIFEAPAKAFFMWGQVNSSEKSLADLACGYFAKVDRSVEEKEALAIAEAKRQEQFLNKVAELAARFDESEE